MTTKKLTKLLALYLPYILLGLVATNFGEAWRLAEGKELGDKIMSMITYLQVKNQKSFPTTYQVLPSVPLEQPLFHFLRLHFRYRWNSYQM